MQKLPKGELKPNRKNYDNMPAAANSYERTKLMKEQIKKLKRKSPDISKMYSVSIPDLRITYYYMTNARCKKKVMDLIIQYPERDLIVKNPVK
jgi:hypothetical protein